MKYATRIENKIKTALNPAQFALRDDSNQHAGHSGSHPSGETHFHLFIRADALNGLGRVAQQRMVYTLLADEMKERVHALTLDVAGTNTL
jgi:BolA family transcriptional regulator, general stress-responsive regulator